MKKQYRCTWTKHYIRTGEFVISATSEDEAGRIADTMIGNEDGRSQYLADKNDIIVVEEIQ